jgi:glycosyltransferase involved in cell wall biosynthesis
MQKIRLLFQVSSLGYGGTEKAIYTFLENLNKDQFEPYLFFYTDYQRSPYYRRLLKSFFSKSAKNKFHEKYVTNMARLQDFKRILGEKNFFTGNTSDFFNAVKTIHPDIIHFNRGIKETFFTKDIHKIPNHIKLVESNIFGKTSNKNYLHRIHRIFFVSKWLIQQSPWAPEEKTALLYNPIKLPSSKTTLRTLYNIPSTAIVLGRMSRPNLDDGEFIANVLKNVLDDNVYFFAIGASQSLKEKMAEYKNVIFIDPTTDTDFISSFYNTIDVLLHYRKEGETFGMNIAEAMIHGKPVISHESYMDNAQCELLLGEKAKLSGIVVKENDFDAYIVAVKTLICNEKLRLELGSNAKQRAQENFAEDSVTQQLENFYLELFA